jgi:hypothetical protein
MSDMTYWVVLAAIIGATLFFIILINITYHLSAIHQTADQIREDLKVLDSIRRELSKVESNTDKLDLTKYYTEKILEEVRDLTLLKEIRAINSNQDKILKETQDISSLIRIQTEEINRQAEDLYDLLKQYKSISGG